MVKTFTKILNWHPLRLRQQAGFFRMCASASSSTVLSECHGNKGVITLNRPKALNAINLDMVCDIYNLLRMWENEKSLVIIKGVGDKSFCAGGDVRAVVSGGDCAASRNFFREEYRLNALIASFSKPFVSLIDGITMGGGVGLSVHGKYRVATERSLFAMPETAIGFFPDVGGSYFLPKLPGKLGLYLGLTGFQLKGEDVLKAGIATHFVSSPKLNELEHALLRTNSNDGIVKVLTQFCEGPSSKDFVLTKHLPSINKCFSASTVEDIITNLENDGSDWAIKTLKTFRKMSPTSLKVTKQQLELGAGKSLQECLKMEYRMAVKHLIDSDFKEGVRAMLVDKDQLPKWNPSALSEVTQNRVNFFFTKLPDCEELTL